MLYGEKLFLRPLQRTDIDKTLKWRNDMFIKSSTASHPFPITYEQENTWYENILSSKDNSKIYFAICDIKSNVMIGYIFLYNLDWINRNCFWGGAIGDRDNIGKGFGKEAVILIIKYAFANLNMHKVYAQISADHPAIKTWMQTGAVEEGRIKEHLWSNSKFTDMVILAWYSSI